MQIIKAVPTNIITGALGVGKTTFIQALLASKPAHERWAILVNEFGEIGLDGALLSASKASVSEQQSHIFIREVPGGCMCCASGLPMQIALNQLLVQAKPDRLLIEPTGLGHPKEVIQVLASEHYQSVLSLHATLCLVDARKLANKRWREHPTFQEQFEVADHILMTKTELYDEYNISDLYGYLASRSISNTKLKYAYQQQNHMEESTESNPCSPSNRSIDFTLLAPVPVTCGSAQQSTMTSVGITRQPKPEQHNEDPNDSLGNGIQQRQKSSEGFYSQGWRWPAEHWFDYDTVHKLIKGLAVVRVKAVMITHNGIFSFNKLDAELNIKELDEALDSRLEIIANSESAAEQANVEIEKMSEQNIA